MKYSVGPDKQKQQELDEIHKQREEEAGSPLRRKKEKIALAITQKMTKRPHLKIMQKLRLKLAQKLEEKLGLEHGELIRDALEDKQVAQHIKMLINQDKLKIVDKESGKTLYQNEMKQGSKLTYEKEMSQSKPFTFYKGTNLIISCSS